jgi:type II secretion system protein N
MSESTLRILRPLGIAFAGLFLVACFVVIRFPYERLASRVERLLANATDAVEVSVLGLAPAFGLAGPVIEAEALVLSGENSPAVRVEPFRFRPALSLGMFRGELALYVDARTTFGHAVGTVYLGATPGFSGSLDELDLKDPFFETVLPLKISGAGSFEVDVALEPEGPDGSIAWQLQEGSVFHDAIPLTIPFSELRGELDLREGVTEVRNVELVGPAFGAVVQGTIGSPGASGEAVVDLKVALSEITPTMRSTLGRFRVNATSDGTAEVRISGTAANPVVRSAAR